MAYGQKFLYACLELLNECMFPVKPNGPHHAKRARTTWHVISSNLHLKSSARNGSSNWLLIQGGIFTVSICYFWSFITSIVLLGEWSGQKSLKVKMDKMALFAWGDSNHFDEICPKLKITIIEPNWEKVLHIFFKR